MPAAAVIPAPVAYIKVVVVKKLVVGCVSRGVGSPPDGGVNWRVSEMSCRWRFGLVVSGSLASTRFVRLVGRRPLAPGQVCPVAVLVNGPRARESSVEADRHVYFEQIRVLKAGKQSVTGRKVRPPEYCVHRITE